MPVAASYIEVDADGKPQMMLKESFSDPGNIFVNQPLAMHGEVKRQIRFNLNQLSRLIGAKLVDYLFLF